MPNTKTRLQQLRDFLTLLNTADPADVRRAQLLKPILQAALAVMLVVGPVWILLSPAGDLGPSVILAMLAVVTIIWLVTLARRGHVRAASVGLPTIMLVVYVVALLALGGVRSPVTSGLFMVVVMAHVLLGERGAIVFVGLAVLGLLGVYLSEKQGLVAIWTGNTDRAWALTTAQLLLMARLLSLTLRPMRVDLEDARREQSRETERARELDALLQAHGALVSTLELDPLLDNILEAALAAIPAGEKGTVLLTDPSQTELQIRALHGYHDPRIKNLAFVATRGYSARTLRERRARLIDDATADPEIRYDGDIPELRAIRSAIAAPLLLKQEPVGVISLDATRPSAFTERDLRLLEAFANAAVVAISNAHLHAEVQALANQDALTGTANRRILDTVLPVEVARAQRYNHPVSLIFIDLDSFKVYNDTYGHLAGDERLRGLAELIHGLIRYPDLLARYGGEEFALLLPHTDKAGAMVLAERLRAAAQDGAGVPGEFVPGYTISLGVATFPQDALTAEDLLRAADEAEGVAKRAGKNRVRGAPALPTEKLHKSPAAAGQHPSPARKRGGDE